MTHQRLFPNLTIRDIFLPSDFSEASEIAFVHALKLALASKSALTMLHVASNANEDWQEFPGVRQTLERWMLLPADSPKSAVADLEIDVRKIVLNSRNPVDACMNYLEVNNADLIILSVKQRDGIMGWFGKSVGKPLAKKAKQMTLFIQEGVNGFVAREDGSVMLKNVLIPISTKPSPQPAIEAVIRLIEGLGLPPGQVTLLYVGAADEAPQVSLPAGTGWNWKGVVQEGEPAEVILKTADRLQADLIVMTTDGPDGFLDGLRGSTSERVLRGAKCPVGILPVDSFLG